MKQKEFSKHQQKLILVGEEKYLAFNKMLDTALDPNAAIIGDRHEYIVGDSGIGKTVSILNALERADSSVEKIFGFNSMSALAMKLALCEYRRSERKNKKAVVWIEDSSKIFNNSEALTTIMLATDDAKRELSWGVNLDNARAKCKHISINDSQETIDGKKELLGMLNKYRADAGSILVPTDNLIFVMSSNLTLFPASDITDKTSNLHRQQAALRNRVTYRHYTGDKDVSWGWTAHVFLNNNVLNSVKKESGEKYIEDVTLDEKKLILMWLYDKWDILADRGLHTVKKLAVDMRNYPNSYLEQWNDSNKYFK